MTADECTEKIVESARMYKNVTTIDGERVAESLVRGWISAMKARIMIEDVARRLKTDVPDPPADPDRW